MMLSQVVKKYHSLNMDAHNTTSQLNAELYSYELDCSAIQLLIVLCLLVGVFQIVMGTDRSKHKNPMSFPPFFLKML